MSPLTRRRALQGAVGLLAGIAGCAGEGSHSGPPDPSDPNAEVETNPDAYVLRASGEKPVVWRGANDGRADGTDSDDRFERVSYEFIADTETVESLSFASVDGVDEVRAFLDATDYDAETVYLEQTAVGECFRRELCHVQWTETEIDTSYARRFRDVDVACDTDAKDTVAWFIRIPDAIDPDDVRSFGSSYGSSSCRLRNDRRAGAAAGAER